MSANPPESLGHVARQLRELRAFNPSDATYFQAVEDFLGKATPGAIFLAGCVLGPREPLLAKTAFEDAIQAGKAQGHLGLAWLALWDGEERRVWSQLRAFLEAVEEREAIDDAVLHPLLQGLYCSGLALPDELKQPFLDYCDAAAGSTEVLPSGERRAVDLRPWFLSGMASKDEPQVRTHGTVALTVNALLTLVVLAGISVMGWPWWLGFSTLVFIGPIYWTRRQAAQRGVLRQMLAQDWQERDPASPQESIRLAVPPGAV